MGSKSVKKVIPQKEFILLSEVVSEAKEKFEGYNLRTQLNQYLMLQGKIFRVTSYVKKKNKIEVKHKLAALLLNGIETLMQPEARN